MQHRTLLALTCSLSASIQFANAQESNQSLNALEEIIITSSRIETPLRQVGTSVSIIDAIGISNDGSASLIDVLRTLPSISVTNAGGAGQVSNLRIRGEEGYRTLTLLDGIKLSDPSSTQVQPQLEHLLSSGVERVEILRGPQGLHYGADAGGVVNITTEKNTGALDSQVEASSGKFGTRQVAAKVSGGNDRADFFVSGTDFETDGFNARQSDSVLADDDGYENTTLHARVGINASESLRFNAVIHDVTSDSEYDACYDSATFSTVHQCNATYDQQALRLSANLTTEYGSHGFAWSGTQTDREYFTLGQSGFASQGELQRLEYIGQYTAAENYELVYGVDLEQEENNGDSRDQLGYYAEYLSTFSDDLFFTAAIRRDDNDDFGTHNSYRLSAARLIDLEGGHTLKLRGAYGTGFRAPSPYESSYNKGPYAYPPASTTSLTEETSKGHEFAVELFTQLGSHFEVVYFDQRIEDAIYYDLANYSGYLQDIGESRSNGVEFSASIPLHAQLKLQANYTYNETERPDGSQRQLRPRNLANMSLAWNSSDNNTLVSAFYRRSADTQDAIFGAPVSLDAIEVFDLTSSYKVNESVQLFGRIENLFDQDNEEILGYNTAQRAAYIGFRLNF